MASDSNAPPTARDEAQRVIEAWVARHPIIGRQFDLNVPLVELMDTVDAALAAAHEAGRRAGVVEGMERMRERAASVADDEVHGNALAAGAIGIGGSTRAHAIMSQRADAAREVAAAIRALPIEEAEVLPPGVIEVRSSNTCVRVDCENFGGPVAKCPNPIEEPA